VDDAYLEHRRPAQEELPVLAGQSVRDQVAAADRADEVRIDLGTRGMLPQERIPVLELPWIVGDITRLPPVGDGDAKRGIAEHPIRFVPWLARAACQRNGDGDRNRPLHWPGADEVTNLSREPSG